MKEEIIFSGFGGQARLPIEELEFKC